ncbi:L,D-transpeptidase family protein [Sphingomonas sp.]|uniref:L,D-transpeptidase family protein n=1 Tax=Sphingomonas sp. TaxID=28214 RepID=UPI00286E230C|nr:L,D-transpeptidase family protein [Sphingomonas sp.]
MQRAAIAGALAAALLPGATTASAKTPLARTAAATASPVETFYRARGGRPLWLAPAAGDAAEQLIRLLSSSEVDGLAKGSFEVGALLVATRAAASGDAQAVKRAETMLSEAFVAYAAALQSDPRVGVIYVDPELKPAPSKPLEALQRAAQAPSLAAYISEVGWMNPVYGQLRHALHSSLSEQDRYVLSLNLQRARALPAGAQRYVLVNTANQRLYMVENGKVADEMKVVVGRRDAQTPLMNAFIRHAVMNPYWNVPTDITGRLAPNVLKRGTAYLKQQGYEVVSDFGPGLRVIDAATIDWKAVAAGKLPVQMRQLPGPANSMGRIKYMFPNSQGVWLHDTPQRQLFAKSVRVESAGCVRLEDAWRLGSWLFGRELSLTTEERERRIDLPAPVPVFITYLTAVPGQPAVRFIGDVYGRDPPRL